jgi:ribulose-phosphate 3-epimerase
MSIIVPAILPSSRRDLVTKLEALSGLVDEVQVDIVDGLFASPATWPYDSGPSELSRMLASGDLIPRSGECRIEIDLMAKNPEATVGAWIELGASRVTLHADSSEHIKHLLQSLATSYGHDKGFATGLLSIGIAINPGTDPEVLAPYLDQIDYVQFMGIKRVGRQGEPFDMSILKSIDLFRRRHPSVPVQVDGGVSLITAPRLLEIGVSRLVVGSALWKAPDLKEALHAFKVVTEEHGIYE